MGKFVETKASCISQGVIAHMEPSQKMYYLEGKHSINIWFALFDPPEKWVPKRSPTFFLSAFPKKKLHDHRGALNK